MNWVLSSLLVASITANLSDMHPNSSTFPHSLFYSCLQQTRCHVHWGAPSAFHSVYQSTCCSLLETSSVPRLDTVFNEILRYAVTQSHWGLKSMITNKHNVAEMKQKFLSRYGRWKALWTFNIILTGSCLWGLFLRLHYCLELGYSYLSSKWIFSAKWHEFDTATSLPNILYLVSLNLEILKNISKFNFEEISRMAGLVEAKTLELKLPEVWMKI